MRRDLWARLLNLPVCGVCGVFYFSNSLPHPPLLLLPPQTLSTPPLHPVTPSLEITLTPPHPTSPWNTTTTTSYSTRLHQRSSDPLLHPVNPLQVGPSTSHHVSQSYSPPSPPPTLPHSTTVPLPPIPVPANYAVDFTSITTPLHLHGCS